MHYATISSKDLEYIRTPQTAAVAQFHGAERSSLKKRVEASDLTMESVQLTMLAYCWPAVFVLLIAALSALYARRGHSKASPEPLPTVMPTLLTDLALSEEKPCHQAAARRRTRGPAAETSVRRPAAETSVAAPDTSDASSESDSNDDDGLQSLLQMRSPAHRVAEPSMRMRSPTVALQPTQSSASGESEPPEAGWDAAATPRKRATRATSRDPAAASCRSEPSSLPAGDTAGASDDQLEDWGELYSAHSKVRCAPGSTRYPPHPILTSALLCAAQDASHRRKGKHSNNVRIAMQREYSIDRRAAQRGTG